MSTVICQTKQWGNSIGVIIPRQMVKELKIKPHEEIVIEIKEKKVSVLKELFGAVRFSKPPHLLVKEARKELESKYMR